MSDWIKGVLIQWGLNTTSPISRGHFETHFVNNMFARWFNFHRICSKGTISSESALGMVIAWRLTCDKLLLKPISTKIYILMQDCSNYISYRCFYFYFCFHTLFKFYLSFSSQTILLWNSCFYTKHVVLSYSIDVVSTLLNGRQTKTKWFCRWDCRVTAVVVAVTKSSYWRHMASRGVVNNAPGNGLSPIGRHSITCTHRQLNPSVKSYQFSFLRD